MKWVFDGLESCDGRGVGHARRPVLFALSIMGSVFGLLFLCASLLFVTVMQPDSVPWILPTAVGATVVFAGLSIWSGTGHPMWAPFLFAGAVTLSLSVSYGLGDADVQFAVVNIAAPVCGVGSFAVIGVCFMAVPRAVHKKMSGVHTLAVQAVVCGKHESSWTDEQQVRQVSYRLDWKYSIGGKERVYRSTSGRRPEAREVGDTGILYVNPADYDDVWEQPDRRIQKWMDIAGALFVAAGAAGLVYVLSSSFLPAF